MKENIVRKGIETEPKVWDMFIPYFYVLIILSVLIVMSGLVTIFFSIQSGGDGWKIGLWILAIGIPGLFVLRSILKSKSVSDKRNFKKNIYTISNSDLLKFIK